MVWLACLAAWALGATLGTAPSVHAQDAALDSPAERAEGQDEDDDDHDDDVDDETDDDDEGADGFDPHEGQAPGLGRAASDIFYADKAFTFSGYAEVAINTGFDQPRDTSSGDLELYYDSLIRAAPFFGFRLLPRWFWISELGLEFFQGAGETDFDFFPESYFDVLVREEIALRVGIQPLFIGYINNNEEPVLYQSVNRPEVERLIIPSEWIEVGATFYGDAGDFGYALMVTHGPDLGEAQSATWIRNGAEARFKDYAIALNAQVAYHGIPFTEFVVSGYWSYTGGETIERDSGPEKFWTHMGLVSVHARLDFRGFTFIGLGTVGFIEDTEGVFLLTEEEQGSGQVIGRRAYGFYVEFAYDIAHTWERKLVGVVDRPKSPFRIGRIAIPIFVRYERLNTHASVAASLANIPFFSNDLHVIVAGINFRPNHVVAIKLDGRFRNNLAAAAGEPRWERLLEFGIGLEF
ncbi:MAG: hypothetical protein AAF436_10190 [Myxococcota bacterium]